jgi:hypothetical protein
LTRDKDEHDEVQHTPPLERVRLIALLRVRQEIVFTTLSSIHDVFIVVDDKYIRDTKRNEQINIHATSTDVENQNEEKNKVDDKSDLTSQRKL